MDQDLYRVQACGGPSVIARLLEYTCYAVIFGGVAFAWITTPEGMN